MKRGNVVLVADGSSDYASKPRPGLIVQADAVNAAHGSISICPITSVDIGAVFFRVPMMPNQSNGLRVRSSVEIDKVQAVRRERVGRVVGHADPQTMVAIDGALRRWLDL